MKFLAHFLVVLAGVGMGEAVLAARAPAGDGHEAEERVRLAPRFSPGQTLRYQLEVRSTVQGATSGVMENPHAPKHIETSVSVVVRLEVLGAAPRLARGGVPPGVRLRATYEKLIPATRADVYDPQLARNETQLRKLEGRCVTFTLDEEGRINEVDGLGELDPEQRTLVEEWLAQLAGAHTFPREGIVPGQKWSSNRLRSVAAPLAGLTWTAESTYLRNESCLAGIPEGSGSRETWSTAETCAVIFTRFQVSPRNAPRDPTPEEYRRQGLRTAGKMSGSAESLTYVALDTGWVVSLTQHGVEEMDLTVSTAAKESSIRYSGRVRTESQLTLLREASSPN